jgi:hypothetical protein
MIARLAVSLHKNIEVAAFVRLPTTAALSACGSESGQQGIVMPGHPEVGDSFRPEYDRGTQRTSTRIVDLSVEVTAPYSSFRNVLVMSEQSLGLKFHAQGFGQIKESVPQGPHETLGLASIRRGQ